MRHRKVLLHGCAYWNNANSIIKQQLTTTTNER